MSMELGQAGFGAAAPSDRRERRLGVRAALSGLVALLLCLSASPPAAAQASKPAPPETVPPVEVLVLGVYHMNNPGQDVFNMKADDVLLPARQAEIRAVTAALARFRPTKVAVEWPAELTAQRWSAYRRGELPPSRNEVVQLGFRLAAATGSEVLSVDADGDFPWEPLQAMAKARNQSAVLGLDRIAAKIAEQERALSAGGVPGVLRLLNQPAEIADSHGLYMNALKIGQGEQQPGVDLLTAWYRRNARICANLLQSVRPGDRVVVMFGAGHSRHLRQCAAETPGVRLVEALDYLPPARGSKPGR